MARIGADWRRGMSQDVVLLVGAGGHAKAIVEALGDDMIAAYVDGEVAPWLKADQIGGDDIALQSPRPAAFVMGLGGVSPKALTRRFSLFERYLASGRTAPAVCHATAHVSPSARIEAGAIILAGAIVQPNAVVGRAAIVNAGAIVEHDSHLGAGCHIAPGALVLGGVTIGCCTMIGAGAVILPHCKIGDADLIQANELHPRQADLQ